MPRAKSYWDSLQDHPIGRRAIRFLFKGIDKNPSLLQRAGLRTADFLARNTAYLADLGLQMSKRFRNGEYKPRSAGTRPVHSGSFVASSVGSSRVPTRRSKPMLKGGWAGRRKSVKRLKPFGPVSTVYKQLKLGMSNMSSIDVATGARYTGTTNTQIVCMNARLAKNFMDVTTSSSRWVATSQLVERISGAGRWYTNTAVEPNTAIYGSGKSSQNVYFPFFNPVVSGTGGLVGNSSTYGICPLPRQTWELGTANQLRDYMCHAYSLLATQSTPPNIYSGYIPSTYTSTTTQGGVTTYTYYPNGTPDFASASFGPFARSTTSDSSSSVDVLPLYERQPLFLKDESISFNLRNPTEQKMYITMYELVPREDVPLVSTYGPDSIQICEMGAWPDPAYLWQYDLLVAEQRDGAGSNAGSGPGGVMAPDASITGVTDQPSSTFVDGGTYQSYIPGRTVRTPYSPGMRPIGRRVNEWYKVRSKSLTLEGGSNGALSFTIKHNRVLKADDVLTTFARRNKSALYMMVVKGERMIGKNAVSLFEQDANCTPDVLMEWRKTASFCRFQQRPQRNRIYVPRALRTDITGLVDMDPADGEFEAEVRV